ncbi:MAG: hypothetical protein JKY52_07685, partial [Flavobacteriales bacterium]|nr:hypothetical protein [Flavobacteriales bacterium]
MKWMQRTFLLASVMGMIILGAPAWAQVGIGTTTPDASAVLDLTSTTKGMLISRLTMVQRNAIVSPATGLLVYQTDNNPAYYYNAGTPGVPNWVRLFSGSSAGGWDLSGNVGTTVGTHFLGTTDAQDLAIYTNNLERLRVTSAGNVGIGTTTPDVKLEVVGQAKTSGTFTGYQWEETDQTLPQGVWRFSASSGNLFLQENTAVGGDFSTVNQNLVLKSGGNVGIGMTDPSTKLQVNATGAIGGDGILLYDNNTSAVSPVIEVRGRRSDGNTSQGFSGGLALASLHTTAAVPIDKKLGTIYFGGNHTDGTESNLLYSGSISGVAEGTFSNATTMSTGLAFFTGSTGTALGNANIDYGTERMRINNAGNVGIGTTNPTGQLTLKHQSNGWDGSVRLISQDGTSTWNIHSENASGPFMIGEAGNSALNILHNGNVGIGTSTPEARLDLNSSVPNDVVQLYSGASTQWHLGVGDASGSYFSVYEEGLGATPRLVIRKISGNVGIGIANPGALLHVEKSVASAPIVKIINTSGGNGEGLWIETTDGNGIGDALKVVTYRANTPKTMLRIPNHSAGNAKVLLAENDGNVGIGTSSPSAKLDVSSTTSGVLIPRVTLVQRNAIGAPVTSELVFQTDNTPGYYYWDGAAWVQMLTGSGSGSGWSTTGNAGLSAATNFVGTTDKVPLVFRTDNIERMRVDTTTGNVGIGTNDPWVKLHVDHVGDMNAAFQVGDITTVTSRTGVYLRSTTEGRISVGSGAAMTFFNGGSAGTERMRIDGAGNVGIGTTTPSSHLDIEKPRPTIELTNTNGGSTWGLISGVTGGFEINEGATTSGTDARLYVEQGGNVGIGTTLPQDMLHVYGTSGDRKVRIETTDLSGEAVVYLRASDADAQIAYERTGVNTGDLKFEVDNGGLTEMMRITSTGNVGIGTTAPTVKTHVFNTVDGTFTGLAIDNRKTYGVATGTNEISRIILSLSEAATTDPLLRVMGYLSAGTESEASSTEGFMAFGTRTAATETEKMRITSAGNVGIGTTGPSYKLDIEGIGTSGGLRISPKVSTNRVFQVLDRNDVELMRVDDAGEVG